MQSHEVDLQNHDRQVYFDDVLDPDAAITEMMPPAGRFQRNWVFRIDRPLATGTKGPDAKITVYWHDHVWDCAPALHPHDDNKGEGYETYYTHEPPDRERYTVTMKAREIAE